MISLQGFEKKSAHELGAVNVMTGDFTGGSPKDKIYCKDDTPRDTVCGPHRLPRTTTSLLHRKYGKT